MKLAIGMEGYLYTLYMLIQSIADHKRTPIIMIRSIARSSNQKLLCTGLC
jgi:hypothetical protein